jgi:lipid-A-disaccharide synthase
MTEIFVVAGEASGDGHAAKIVSELKSLHPHLHFFGMTGPKLEAQGVERIFSSSEIAVMGIVEVIPKLRHIFKILDSLTAVALKRKPKLAILVDAQDFNSRLAKRLTQNGIKVITVVAPTVWAWRSGRTKQLAKNVNEVLCVLPFEEKFLRDRHVNATYIGSPVLDDVPEAKDASFFRQQLNLKQHVPTLALLPGSRRSEIKRILPVMVQVALVIHKQKPDLQIVIPVAPGLDSQKIEEQFLQVNLSPVLISGNAPAVVGACDVAVVASGTATLEAGLMLRPLVAIYKVNWGTYFIGKAMATIKYFSLVNLLLDRPVITELLQQDMTVQNIVNALDPLWIGPQRDALIAELSKLRTVLGPGGASKKAANIIATHLNPN